MTTPTTAPDSASSAALLRSTLIAIAVAAALLVTCVLPAEYGKDLTGIGRVLGLTQMGETKMALAEEAAANAAAEASADSVIAAAEAAAPAEAAVPAGEPATTAAAVTPSAPVARTDTTTMTLAPTKGGEIKLVMRGGATANYRWAVTNGVVNFDMHGDSTNAPKNWYVSYRKGQGAAADSGQLVAGFNGNHGWFWRNRGTQDVMVRLITSGDYSRVDIHP
jgi:hypothetical protein